MYGHRLFPRRSAALSDSKRACMLLLLTFKRIGMSRYRRGRAIVCGSFGDEACQWRGRLTFHCRHTNTSGAKT
jgi:hypothetical protein